MPPLRITSADNPRIKALQRLRQQKNRREVGLFIAEGMREVERALAAGLPLAECYVCPELWHEAVGSLKEKLAQSSPAAPPIELPAALFRKVAYNENPEGVLGTFAPPDWGQPGWQAGTLPPTWPSCPPGPELWLVAVGTQKPGNLGAMARSAEAAGVRGILVDDPVVDPFNPNAIRTSTAAVFFLPVVAATRNQILAFLRARQVGLLATSPAAEKLYSDVDLTMPMAVVIGPEDRGLDSDWLEAVAAGGGQAVAIPLRGQVVDSLNASNAAAIMLFEALRQRQAQTARRT